jgi:hypothetical protein
MAATNVDRRRQVLHQHEIAATHVTPVDLQLVGRNSDSVFRQSNRLSAQYADAIAPYVLDVISARAAR